MASTYRSVSCTGVLTVGFATLFTSMIASTAHAAHYKVLTSSIAADLINASDGYCSLAEAVKSINTGSSVANCYDVDASNPGQITLIQASGKSYAAYHYKINNTTLTLNRPVRIQTSEEGFVAYIDSSGALAFKVSNGVEASFYGLNMSHTGTGSGRVIWNAGTLNLSVSVVRNGNVTTEPAGLGGGIYNERTGSLFVYSSQVLNNKAKRGGGIYNDDGEMYLNATISGNSATMAGGGLYNKFTGVNPSAIVNLSADILSNSAKAGGGIANVGGTVVTLGVTNITSNTTVAGTGSGETCHSGTCTPLMPGSCHSGPCDGNGAGVLNLDTPSQTGQFDVRTYDLATISNNTATQFGGGIYNTGLMNLSNVKVTGNRAKSGAGVFASALVDSSSNPYPNYCEFKDTYGPSIFTANVATGTPSSSVYGILDSSGASQTYCMFIGASGTLNSKPYCNPLGVRPGFFCPQTAP